MLVKIEKPCFDRDQPHDILPTTPHVEVMADHWHPAARLLFIAGSATALWAVLFAMIA